MKKQETLHHIATPDEIELYRELYGHDIDSALILNDFTFIGFVHDQDCCESVYADLSALEDTGFFDDKKLTRDNLLIQLIKGYGVRVNGYGIPCYNEQNGYYSSNIRLIVDFDVDTYGHTEIV